MGIIIKYEIAKVLKKKMTIIAFVIFTGLIIMMSLAGMMGRTYVDGKFFESHMQRNKINRKNGVALSGRKIDSSLIKEVQDAYKDIDMTDRNYLFTEAYKNARKYSGVHDVLMKYAGSGAAIDITEEELYKILKNDLTKGYEDYELSEKEIAYWEEKDKELPDKLTYEYCDAYDSIISMQGCYMIAMLLFFLIAICMGNLFMDEHTRKTDQIVLCTKNGRAKLYFAKVAAGTILVMICTVLYLIIFIMGRIISYGYEGFNAAIQLCMFKYYPYKISVGQVLMLFIFIVLLSCIMTGIITMVLSELMHNSIGAMAIIVGLTFASRLISVPFKTGFLGMISKLWNCMPLNILYIYNGFSDLRLFSIFGIKFTLWQITPVLYILAIIIFILIGKRTFCKTQISGQ